MSHTYSMRKRILLGLIAALVVIMGAAGTISYNVALHETDEIFSARLATSARVLDSLLGRQVEHATIEKPLVIKLPDELMRADPDERNPVGHPYETKLAFQVWSEEGRLLVRSESAPTDRLGPLKAGFWERDVANQEWHVFTLKSNRVWIEVAEETGVRREIASDVGVVLSSPLFVGSALLLLLVNLIVIAGFRPLSRLAQAIEERDPKNNTPIELSNTPDEITPVVQALNSLLKRVRSVLDRERRFTDSAAHELRTPLTALSIHAQNLAMADDEDERAESLAHLLTGLSRTKQLVEQMLAYSRLGSQSDGEALSRVDLCQELGYLVNNQRTVMEGSGIQIEWTAPHHSVWIQARKGQLEVLLRNLLDNACKYTLRPEEPVRVELLPVNELQIALRVSNSASLMSTEESERIFEPYHRLPNAHQKGNGLGLAMVKDIAELHGWPIKLSQEPALGRLTIELIVSVQKDAPMAAKPTLAT